MRCRQTSCLGLLFGALVGVLFLSVLLLITVWGHSPLAGAAIVSVLPVAALAARPLERRLESATSVRAGSALLAAGLVGLALLPSTSVVLVVWALALCGAGSGWPSPSSRWRRSPPRGPRAKRDAVVAVRHLGLVLALPIAPLLASSLPDAADRALLRATAVVLDAPVGLSKKVPVALDLRKALDQANAGGTAGSQGGVRCARRRLRFQARGRSRRRCRGDQATVARAFRPAFLICAGFAAAALALALVMRGRPLGMTTARAAVVALPRGRGGADRARARARSERSYGSGKLADPCHPRDVQR